MSVKQVRVLASITGPKIKLMLEDLVGKPRKDIKALLDKMKPNQKFLMVHIIRKYTKKELDLSSLVNAILWEMSDGEQAVELTKRRKRG